MSGMKTSTAAGAIAIGIALFAPVSASADCKGVICKGFKVFGYDLSPIEEWHDGSSFAKPAQGPPGAPPPKMVRTDPETVCMTPDGAFDILILEGSTQPLPNAKCRVGKTRGSVVYSEPVDNLLGIMCATPKGQFKIAGMAEPYFDENTRRWRMPQNPAPAPLAGSKCTVQGNEGYVL